MSSISVLKLPKMGYKGETATYIACDATPDERTRYWERAKQMYVGFEAYQRRTDREIPIVVLSPVDE